MYSGSSVSVFPNNTMKVINVLSLSRVIVPNVTVNAALKRIFALNSEEETKVDWN